MNEFTTIDFAYSQIVSILAVLVADVVKNLDYGYLKCIAIGVVVGFASLLLLVVASIVANQVPYWFILVVQGWYSYWVSDADVFAQSK